MARWLRAVLFLALLLTVHGAIAAPTLGPLFTDHAVLQRDVPCRVWGEAEAGAAVVVSIAGARAETRADDRGRWSVTLPAKPAGGPHELRVESGGEAVTLEDVLFGDVWICSGQSNMAWPLAKTSDGAKWIAESEIPDLRLLKVALNHSREPRETFNSEGWSRSAPNSTPGFTSVGWHFGRSLVRRAGVPVGLIHTAWGGTPAEAWTPMPTLRSRPDAFATILDRVARHDAAQTDESQQRRGSVLYNAMIHPLTGYSIAGAIWYQAESNLGRHAEYAELFPAMIASWREAWAPANEENRDFPFLFVQLPDYLAPQWRPVENYQTWPPLRAAQAAALELPNTAMAVTLGLGDAADVHPIWKRPIGERLAEGAMRVWHGDPDADERAPTFRSMTREGDALRVRFDHAEGLRASDGRDVEGFAIAGPDGVFRWAFATIEDGPEGPSVVLRKGEVQDPVHAAYAWANNPRCNLVNGRGVPARPFRTDRDPQWADE